MTESRRVIRLSLSAAVLCAALAGTGNGQARASSGTLWTVNQYDTSQSSAQAVLTAAAPTLELVLAPFNLQAVDTASFSVTQNAMNAQLAASGLNKTGRAFVDGQQIDTWYSAVEDRSVVCVAWAEGERHSQLAYVMPGKIRRSDVMSLP